MVIGGEFTNLFNVCMLVGIVLPLLSLILGGIGDFLDFDFDFDADGGFDFPIPITPMTIAFALVVFGAIGRFSGNWFDPWPSLFIGIASGVLGGCLLGRFVVLPLKRNRAEAQAIEDLTGQVGKVKLEIRQDFVGTITVLSSIGSLVTYSARPVPGIDKIPVGTKVQVLEVDSESRVCVVDPLPPYAEDWYDSP